MDNGFHSSEDEKPRIKMAPLSLSVLQAIFYKLGMEDDLSIFIRFRSVCSDFLSLAHQVGTPIKFNYHYLQTLSYRRLFPATTLALSPNNVTLPSKIRAVSLDIYKGDVNIKADHLQSLHINIVGYSQPQVTIDAQSANKMVLHGQNLFFSLKFPVRELQIHSTCDASLFNLEHVEKLCTKGYWGLTHEWPVFPRLKYLTEDTKIANQRRMTSFFFPNLRRLVRYMHKIKIFEGELLLVHSISALEATSGPGYDLYLTRDTSKIPSRENIVYLVDRVEKQDILPTSKKNVRLFSDVEITPRIRDIINMLCGEAKIFLQG